MPPIHPMLVHFPIALFIMAVLFDFITAFRLRHVNRRNHEAVRQTMHTLNPATKILMVLGFVGSLAAVASGEWLKVQRANVLPHGLLTLHQALAIVFTIWYLVLAVLRLRRRFTPKGGYLSLAVIGVLILAAVGHTGGTMAWPSVKPLPAATGIASSGKLTNRTAPTSGSTSQKGTAHKTTKKTTSTQSTVKSSTSKTTAGSSTAKTSQTTTKTTTQQPTKTTTKKPAQPTVNQVEYETGYHSFLASCGNCHGYGTVEQYYGQLSYSQWQQVVAQMNSYAGGGIPNTRDIVYYLAHQK